MTNATVSPLFPLREISLADTRERVLEGGRHLLPLLAEAFRGVEEIAVLGWGSQAQAQACNLRDSLRGSGIRVSVGLRRGSGSIALARAAGFTEADGTLGELFELAARADLVLLLISDAAQVGIYRELFDALQPGATLGLSHGFLVGHLAAAGEAFPPDINVVGVCPKGMGPSVRRLYEQGEAINGAGINTSVAVEQDVDGWARDFALAWAVGIGSPFTFETTLDEEYRSDIFGERAVLLGALHAIVESLYRREREQGTPEEEAFLRSCATITGPIARRISSDGLLGLFEAIAAGDRSTFEAAYSATYGPMLSVMAEIYDEVDSGREVAGVVAASRRLERHGLAPIEGGRMWQVGAAVRAQRTTESRVIDPFAAGVFAATMTAQVDLLREKGHRWSECANESVIEAVDSLIPYMDARGVGHMVDNCSTTARLGARKWGPVFEATLSRIVYPRADAGPSDPELIEQFLGHPLHDVLRTLGTFRPPVDIAVS